MEKDGETLKAHGLHLRPECDLVRKVRDNDFAFALKVLPQILLGRSTVPFFPRKRTILCLFYKRNSSCQTNNHDYAILCLANRSRQDASIVNVE